MLSTRIRIAIERELFELPEEGTIAVVGPSRDDDLSMLPNERLEIVTAFFPDHAAWAARGVSTRTEPGGPYAAAIIKLGRSRDRSRRLIAEVAAVTVGPIAIDGQKTDGAEALLKELRKRGDGEETLSKAHGKLAVFTGLDVADWAEKDERRIAERFVTHAGVFSVDGVDPGSAFLAQALPDDLHGHVVDLGAGWGFLSDAVLSRAGVTRVDLVEADFEALSLARRNVDDTRARFHWADAYDFTLDGSADHVVTNPPFHKGRRPEPELGQAFVRAAGRLLKPRGELWLVANRHLPYEEVLKQTFSEVRIPDETPSFKLFHAIKPRRPRRG